MPKIEAIQGNAALLTVTYEAGEADATKIRIQAGPSIQNETQLNRVLVALVIHMASTCETDHVRVDLDTGEISGPPDAKA